VGKTFIQLGSEKERKYCTQECYWEDKKINNLKTCKNCGKNYNKKSDFCNMNCKKEFTLKNKTINCLECDKNFIKTNKNSRFCSLDCYHKYRKQHKEILFQKYQNTLIIKTCKNCGNDYEIQGYRKDISKFCSKKCERDYKNIIKICPTCGKKFKVNKHLKERIFCSQKCISYSNKSKKENEFFELCKKIIPEIKQNERIEIDKIYFPDLKINNIIIEFFGNYWHCNPEIYDENFFNKTIRKTAKEIWNSDMERIEKLSKKYKVYIIWENEWDTNKENILKKIKKIKEENEI